MKVGILAFSYAHFEGFEKDFRATGSCSMNIGDYMQTLAVRKALRAIGVDPADTRTVDRDTLPRYGGDEVALVMNGCFYDWCFPLPAQVRPVFVGFQASPAVIAANLQAFAGHGSIGCRDRDTAQALRGHGIAAHVTGCLTLSLPARTEPPRDARVMLAYGTKTGALPFEALALCPPALLDGAELVFQRRSARSFPLDEAERDASEAEAGRLLDRYRAHASLVITPLHHAATPCLASGIPVVLCRTRRDTRFSTLSEIVPIHVRPDFGSVDWSPVPTDVTAVRTALLAQLRAGLEAAQSPRTRTVPPPARPGWRHFWR